MSWQTTPEQGVIISNTYQDTIVRICGKKDFGMITISALKKYIHEAHTDNFSLIFLRRVIQESFTGQYGFVIFKPNAYSERHAAMLFELLDAFLFSWNRMKLPKSSILKHGDDSYLNIINLPGMQDVLKLVFSVSREDVPVLLLGETGTGKEGVANLIQRGSGRYGRPYVKINCGGIPISLIESKLFGYVKGAFTGALKDTPGAFELANTGVLLLDEVGELPVDAQAALLRVLQEGVIERVGSSAEFPVNVRIIAATNRDLVAMAEKKTFRSDLLYRLGVFPIYIPALRERPEDIPVLLDFFLLHLSKKRGFITPPRLSQSELHRLCSYPWPGNIREMQNAVTRAILLWNGSMETDFRIEVGINLFRKRYSVSAGTAEESKSVQNTPENTVGAQNKDSETAGGSLSADVTGQQAEMNSGSLRMEDVEKQHIARVLALTKGRVTGKGGAAEILDLNPSTLRGRMRKLGLVRN
ncbi:MAG: sigma-54-dependent Fis family transcriptional regulator [Mailhella sp.]|nr:sigma-54-dependent Fis family transcriptional regulator [Mailhella sp.]